MISRVQTFVWPKIFAPWLIGFWLAMFVQGETSDHNPESGPIIITGLTEGPAFGTKEYMCLEYVDKKSTEGATVLTLLDVVY